ncbi:MAG TPA: hypothetical protein VFQ35_14540, partial [Polyangiaceae bacterium]|nr:hypothetical protein [Polyangiaceae bacterium]
MKTLKQRLLTISGRFANTPDKRREVLGFLAMALLLLVVFPLGLDTFRLNLVGKYLTYAFVALG